jgi:hypothetical protein
VEEETFSTAECGQLCFSSKTSDDLPYKNILNNFYRHFVENKKKVLESIMPLVNLIRKEIRVSCKTKMLMIE